MTKPVIREHNLETNEIIDREMTTAEFAQFKVDQKTAEQNKIQVAADAEAKLALLERLGITEDEAKLLLG
jgi:hypothetical protein